MSGIFDGNPFVGPRPIQRGEALFGRDAEVRALYDRLQARRIVVLHSPSGAGKSSLVQAGLIPRLQAAGFDVWRTIRVNLDPRGFDGDDVGAANRYLLSAMVSLEEELPAGRRRGPAELARREFGEYLRSRPRRRGRDGRPVVLIFDQFEEVLTVAPRAVVERRDFFTAVGAALDSGDYWALFLVREDHLAAFAPHRDRIPTQMANTFRLDLLGLAGAREAAERLAATGGRSFPAVDHLVRDLSTIQVQQADGSFIAEQGLHVEPVHLQVVCRRLWAAMPADDRSIDEVDIARHADVSTALADYYAQEVRRIAGGEPAVEREIREWVGCKLVVGGIRSQVRQEAGRSAGLGNARVAALLACYLVRTEQRAGAHWFELSHDRLIEPVLLDNRRWEQENLHSSQVQARLWETGGRSRALLLTAEALPDALAWARESAALLTAGEREFLEQSRVQRAEERAARARLRAAVAAAAVVAVLMGVLGSWALGQRDAALRAQGVAAEQATRARAAAMMAGARELMARGQGGPAALVLVEVEDPGASRGWTQLALDVLARGIPRTTLMHTHAVQSAAWSPDGLRVVTASDDASAWVWSADGSGAPLALAGHETGVRSAAWSPDGLRVATVTADGAARVWRADGSGAAVLAGHAGEVEATAWSPDGARVLTASRDHTARVWRADGTDMGVVLVGHDGPINAAAWSRDGARIVTGSDDGTARVWRADGTGAAVVLAGHEHSVEDVAWSPDGARVVTASFDETARVWLADGTGEAVVLAGHAGAVHSAAWSPDGARVVTASDDETARVWLADGTGEAVVLAGHGRGVRAAAWSPDGARIVTTSQDGVARVWRADRLGGPTVLVGHGDRIHSAAWSPDGARIVTAAEDATARVWQVADGLVLAGHEARLTAAAWRPDGARVLTASIDGDVRVWRADGAGDPIVVRGGGADGVADVAWSPDGARIVAAFGSAAQAWRADDGSDVVVFAGHTDAINDVAWSPDGRWISTASDDRTARVWSAEGAGESVVLAGHRGYVATAAWSPDGRRIVTASYDETVRVWQADGAGEAVVLAGAGAFYAAAWSPDGQHIAAVSEDMTTKVWRADGTSGPVALAGHAQALAAAAWSPDGARVVTAAADRTARVWRVVGVDAPVVLTGHVGSLVSVAWSPDGAGIVTASTDRTARAWPTDGVGEPLVLRGHTDAVVVAAWSPDGARIVTAAADGTARIWPLTAGDLQRALRAATTDCLTSEQRQLHLGEEASAALAGHLACERAQGRRPAR
jgi:WD40 repeat protein